MFMREKIDELVRNGEAFKGKLVRANAECLRFVTEEGIEEIPMDWCRRDTLASLLDSLESGRLYIVVEEFGRPGKEYILSIYDLNYGLVNTVSRNPMCH
jgi:hypothetical protein